MLPTPASFSRRSGLRRNASITPRKTLSILLSRSHITNLALLLLSAFAVFSFLFNISFYFTRVSSTSVYTPPSSILSTLAREKSHEYLTHLIVVPGHAIWKGTNAEQLLNEDDWILEPYQRGGGRVSAFYNHILIG
jgi:hypothetical protein